ncbi:MAG: MBL fold metallo-hydrolase [Bacteroides sp.]|nr:MBL fold metallo-hydrolase [Bacteroides sp.]
MMKGQPGLFDLTDEIVGYPKERPEEEGLPPIDDFVVEVKKRREAEQRRRDAVEMDRDNLSRADSIVFISFGSGSSGNCSYVGDADGGFLIDAGVDMDVVAEGLKANGLSFADVKGVCLTHDHSDHIRFVYSLVRKNPHIGVYCTPKTMGGILRRHCISRRLKDYHRPIYKEFAFKVGNFELTAFEVSHDGTDNSGYFITRGEHRFAVATDLGCITPRVDHYMRQARYIMIESNYDAEMLRVGPYPMHLKARIMRETGHLDNAETGRFLASIMSPQLTHVFLCHLSQDNNTPEKALHTVATTLRTAGIDSIGDGTDSLDARASRLQLIALPRFDRSHLYTLRLPTP